ncbi:MAG: phosphopyruvate hydratase [Patescibacteria group bacterium]|nr:phosphopyruvate hydratase [Patescibacteria group bacterium]
MKIQYIDAYEILDSRGNPTVEAKITTESGISSKASVPSGASTGTKEAIELRDGDKERFGGKGVLEACKNIREKIMPAIKGIDVTEQWEIDKTMIELDGTENKSKLGANAILAVSLAVARSGAKYSHLPLWKYLRNSLRFKKDENYDFPVPLLNVINGGVHADSGLDVQEYMIIPSGIKGFANRMRAGAELYHALRNRLAEQGFRVAVGDEGGFAPSLHSNEDALAQIANTVKSSNYELGKQVKIGMDVAASEFYDKKKDLYDMKLDQKQLNSKQMAELYEKWIEDYHIELIEDPMSEFDWKGWTDFNKQSGDKITIVGDDLTVTNKKIVEEAHKKKAINSVLIKVNQIGSLSETAQCIQAARNHDMSIAISHRSGETEDTFIADLAVAATAEYVKFGAPARSERVSKYNRISKIERKHHEIISFS